MALRSGWGLEGEVWSGGGGSMRREGCEKWICHVKWVKSGLLKISFKNGKKKTLKNNSSMSNCFLGFKYRMKILCRVMSSGILTWTLNWYVWAIYRNRNKHRQNLDRFSKGHPFLWIYFLVCYDADFCLSYFYLILSFCL